MLDYERLDVYRAAIDFLAFSHRVLGELPRGSATLKDQLERAALSVPLNIAEGNGKRSGKDRARYYGIARGSAMECGALLDALRAIELVPPAQHEEGKTLLVRIVSMLTRMS